MKTIKTCTSIDCPERRSVCCKAKPVEFVKPEGGGYFICSKCGKEYQGGKCTAENGVQRYYETCIKSWKIRKNI